MDEAQSRRIAGLLGPTIIVMIVSEFPLVQPRLYDAQIPPVVYLSGVLMFVASLATSRNEKVVIHAAAGFLGPVDRNPMTVRMEA